MSARVLVAGTGDVAGRVLIQLHQRQRVKDVVIAGVNAADGSSLSWISSAVTGREVAFETCDFSDEAQVADLVRRCKPDLIVNCASLVSPYFLPRQADEVSRNLVKAGFVSQLPLHIKLLGSLIAGARSVDPNLLIVNLSAPELTGPVLRSQGLAPTIGIGNVGLLFKGVQVITNRDAPGRVLRMLAHHSHLRPSRNNYEGTDLPRPIVYLDDERQDWENYQPWSSHFPFGEPVSTLTAALTSEIVEALLGLTGALRTSAPAPDGLAAGLPVLVKHGEVSLDLPSGLELSEALRINKTYAEYDGIQDIADDGTVTFTQAAREAFSSVDPELAKPLRYGDINARSELLRSIIAGIRARAK